MGVAAVQRHLLHHLGADFDQISVLGIAQALCQVCLLRKRAQPEGQRLVFRPDQTLSPAGAFTHKLPDRQSIEKLVCDQKQRLMWQLAYRAYPLGVIADQNFALRGAQFGRGL